MRHPRFLFGRSALSPPGLRDVTDALAPGGGVGTATAITGVGPGTAVQLVVAAETREAVVATATIGRELESPLPAPM